MPVEMIGWIAPRVSSELIPPSGPPFDAEIIAEIEALLANRPITQEAHCVYLLAEVRKLFERDMRYSLYNPLGPKELEAKPAEFA